MYVLARCYDEGWGCDKNLQMAKDCYELSAEQEFIPAERRLGLCYLYGLGTDKEDSEALSHFNKAAENNDVEYQYYVGDLHKKAGNIEEAFAWFAKAANQDDADAQNALGLCYLERGTSADYQHAEFWLKKAAEKGRPEPQMPAAQGWWRFPRQRCASLPAPERWFWAILKQA